METEEPPVAPSNVGTPKAGSVLKEKKKRLKPVFRKRHHGLVNLSIRNSTLNSTIFKASLKINNRALAQALEKKKSECRVAEAIILKQKEEIQQLTTEVNKLKMIAERTKHITEQHLQAVSGTMHMAVNQLLEAMDACTGGEFRKLSGHLLPPAAATSLLPSVDEQVSLEPQSNVVVRPVTGPSRVTVSAAAATYVDDDEDQDVVASMEPNKDVPPCDGPKLPAVAVPDLSIIMEQSYLVPSETDLTNDEPALGYRRPSSRDRRNMVVFQPSLVDSPAPADDEGSKQDACVRNRTRSRSRQSSGLSTGETRDMLQDAGVTRSRSRDRRNAIIFHPSSDSPDGNRSSAGNCVRILRRSRNRSGQSLEMLSAVKIGQEEEESRASSESSEFRESVAVPVLEAYGISGGDELEQSLLDETLVAETEVLSSEMVGQLGLLQHLAKNRDEGSSESVDETILIPYEESSYVAEAVVETHLSQLSFREENSLPLNRASVGVCKDARNVSESLTGTKISKEIQQKSPVPSVSSVEEAEGLVSSGQFVTRDKIARTPVKPVRHFYNGVDGSVEERAVVHQSGDLSDLSDRDIDELEHRRSRSLSRRDIPTFLPIDSPPIASGTAHRISKATASSTMAQAKGSKFLKAKGTKRNSAGASEIKEKKRPCKPGLVSSQATDTKGDACTDELSTRCAPASRRGTFALPTGGIHFLELDIMMEDDSVLINESFAGTEDDVFASGDELPRDGGGDNGPNEVVSQPDNLPNLNALTAEKNATILMAEDMEQTGVSFTAISISDPPPVDIGQPAAVGEATNTVGESGRSGEVQNGNSQSPEKQQVGGLDELALGEKKSKLPKSCSELVRAKTTEKNRKVHSKEPVNAKETEARSETAEDDPEPTSNVVKRRRVAHSKLKLPASGVAAAGTSSEKDAKSPPRIADAKGAIALDNPVQSLANCNRKRAETESEGEESQEQSMDIESKKRFAAYLSKPGNIVFNADRKDVAGAEVSKKTRSKSRSILPLQQKPRSKASANSAKPEEQGTSSSVWDFKGTPRSAEAKENADRLLSVYDISLSDSVVIPKPKSEADPAKQRVKERSKDDSFIIDKKPSKRRVRHESASAIDCVEAFASGSENAPNGALESPHGIMLVLGNGMRRKPSARSKTVRYEVENVRQNAADAEKGKTDSLSSEMSKDSAADGEFALKMMSRAVESDMVSKLKSAESSVTDESRKEPSTSQAGQLEINHEKLDVDLAQDHVEKEAERISAKDVRLECANSKGDGPSRVAKDIRNPESLNCKDVTERNRNGRGTVKNNDNVVAVNNKNAGGNVKGLDAGKRERGSANAKGKGVVNTRKVITKDATNSVKASKSSDSKGGTNLTLLRRDDLTSSNTASSQASDNVDDAEITVLYANEERTLESGTAAKSDADSADSHDSLQRRKPNDLGKVNSEQKVASSEQRNETESPREAVVQRRAHKRRVVESMDLFEDIDARSLQSPKSKQPVLVEEEPHPVTFAGISKTLLKPDNHQQVDSSTTRHSQSELPKLQGPGNARRDHNSLKLRKNLKATSTKEPESINVPEMAESNEAVIRQVVSEQPLGMAEKISDSNKKLSEKDSSAVPPRQRTKLSTKNAKEKTSQRKSNLPKEERVLVIADNLQTNNNLVGTHTDLDVLEDRGNEDKSRKKRSVIQNRQSSISMGSCDTSSHSEMADRRTRRNAVQAVSYKEPSLGKKLRRGDPHTSTIYGGADPELEKHHGSERKSDARLSRKVLSTLENTSMETE